MGNWYYVGINLDNRLGAANEAAKAARNLIFVWSGSKTYAAEYPDYMASDYY